MATPSHRTAPPVKAHPLAMAAAVVALSLAAVGILSGCATVAPAGASPTSPHSSPHSSTPATTTTTTPSTGSDATPPPVLFTISTTAKASNGARVELVETVYAPMAEQPSLAGNPDDIAFCQKLWKDYPPTDQQWLTSTITATPVGTVAWPSGLRSPVAGILGWDSLFAGDVTDGRAPCALGVLGMSGDVHGIHPVAAGTADAKYGWATLPYGFSRFGDDSAQQGTTFEKCSVEVTPAGRTASTKAATWGKSVASTPAAACMVNASAGK